ncbi:MAG: hypothetical protein AB7P76_01365 [Candidatus Melainabacteria bacterium]
MLKIVIQNPDSETVINNVWPDALPFWEALLDQAVRGDIHIVALDGEETGHAA